VIAHISVFFIRRFNQEDLVLQYFTGLTFRSMPYFLLDLGLFKWMSFDWVTLAQTCMHWNTPGPNPDECFIELLESIIHWVINSLGKSCQWPAYQWIRMFRKAHSKKMSWSRFVSLSPTKSSCSCFHCRSGFHPAETSWSWIPHSVLKMSR